MCYTKATRLKERRLKASHTEAVRLIRKGVRNGRQRLGTVYRNLKKFCENGKAVSVGVINGQEHFDGNVKPHAHFVCRECGAALDVHETFFEENELARISQKFGLSVEEAGVMFRGVCGQCHKKGSAA